MFPTECYQDFEAETESWGLDYTRNPIGGYEDSGTGMIFGSFALGWMARDKR